MNISVCICTFRRPQLLSVLLNAIATQTWCQDDNHVEIVVVDNDPEHSAKIILKNWQSTTKCSLIFSHVSQANIAVARNTTLMLATHDWIAFIDDDEVPESDWLFNLVKTQKEFNADAVFGPVLPRYLTDTPQWIIDGAYFDRPRFKTGTAIGIENARTGNVLIASQCFKHIDGPFDIAFGRTGGEDSLFFRDILTSQPIFVWCDQAPVSEDVPLTRANHIWLLQRSYRVGQTWMRTEIYRLPLIRKIYHSIYLALRAIVQLIVAFILFTVLFLFSRTLAFFWIRKAVLQIGKIMGITRFQYHEYGN
jgi:succinoglycan biosynthesis protein ExoM